MMLLDTPIVVIVSGEGGSGGALGIAIGDRVLMQEYAIYSVIPPEGCAAILWRDPAKKVEAAAALKLTAPDLLAFGIIDEIVPEPVGGAHTDPAAAARLVDQVLVRALAEVSALDSEHAAGEALREVPQHGTARASNSSDGGPAEVRCALSDHGPVDMSTIAPRWDCQACDDAAAERLAAALGCAAGGRAPAVSARPRRPGDWRTAS